MLVMSQNETNSYQHLTQPVKILKDCRSLSERLMIEGLVFELTPSEQTHLLNFEQLLQADYSPSEWSYLRIVSGVKINAVAALSGRLALYRAKESKPLIYGQL